MCGIAAIVAPTPSSATPILAMTDLVRHRGPDDEGYLVVSAHGESPRLLGGPVTPAAAYAAAMPFAPTGDIGSATGQPAVVAFGHRRLSIVELSVLGHQPMCTPDRRHWIIYNGEIYNHRELATELAGLGHTFGSHSDTEVILAAYAEWGPGCLNRLNGMFAFAIYDATAAELFVARDRFGIKPLYYWVAPDGSLCLASEIKQFTAVPGWKAVANRARVTDFVAGGLTDHTDETLFDRVYQLRPGEYLRQPVRGFQVSGSGRVATEKWYTLAPAPFRGSFEDAAAECRRLLTDSVGLMLQADVAVGSCLSGGIDSSSIVCLVHDLLGEDAPAGQQKVFSAVSDVARLDERAWIDEVVRVTAVEGHRVTPTVAALERAMDRLAWHQDEPFGSTSILAQWCVFELAAAHGIKVMLDGQGADEQFAGYHSYFAPYLAGLFSSGSWGTLAGEFVHLRSRHGYRLRHAITGVGRRVLGPSGEASLQGMSRGQLTASNLQMLLHWEDRNSMAHSVESRVPYLDHRLVEFALGLPDAFKLGGGVTKRVLRAAMSGVLPDRIRDRVDKLAFETPEMIWMRQDTPEFFQTRLRDAVRDSRGLISASEAEQAAAIAAGPGAFGPQPWRLISLGQWMQRFSVAVS